MKRVSRIAKQNYVLQKKRMDTDDRPTGYMGIFMNQKGGHLEQCIMYFVYYWYFFFLFVIYRGIGDGNVYGHS